MSNQQLFDEKMLRVKKLYRELMDSTRLTPNDVVNDPQRREERSGVYVFSEFAEAIESFFYVGQANRVILRLLEHCGEKQRDKANFAYKLTVETTGIKPLQGTPSSTKKSMFEDPAFMRGFQSSIKRIRQMQYRFVEVGDKLEKNLLEIYASVMLNSKFNDFD